MGQAAEEPVHRSPHLGRRGGLPSDALVIGVLAVELHRESEFSRPLDPVCSVFIESVVPWFFCSCCRILLCLSCGVRRTITVCNASRPCCTFKPLFALVHPGQ